MKSKRCSESGATCATRASTPCRQLIDEIDSRRFPGLYLLITGTGAFFDGPQGIQRLEPLAQRLQVDFQTDLRFDNPRAVQIRLPAFTLERLQLVGSRSATSTVNMPIRRSVSTSSVHDQYISDLASGVAGKLGGKVGISPRIFLKKLVSDVLDRIDQFDDFDPRKHYALTISEAELLPVERQAMGASNVDEVELEL